MTITRRIDVMYSNTIKDRCQACSEAHYRILDLYLPCPELIQYPCLAQDEFLKSADAGAKLGVIRTRLFPHSKAFDLDLETTRNTGVNSGLNASTTRTPYIKHPATVKGFFHSQILSKSERLEIKESKRLERAPDNRSSTFKDFLRSQVLTTAERKKRRAQEKNWKAGDFRISYDDTTAVISQKRNCI